MADDKGLDGPVEQANTAGPRRRRWAMGGIVLGVMVVEALIVFVLVKNFSASPATAEAAMPQGIALNEGQAEPREVELEVVDIRAQNERSQRQMIYDLSVFVCVSEADKDKVNEIFQRRKATVQDRLVRVIRAADPERFTEPDLRTLRTQFRAELADIVGDENLIREVLIPSIISSEN